ncbi:SGNH/GDSL hydrolase family protein [Streptacidiphilus jiangxiensis]|uniref:GDSL-like Lipase/Acylhydrolase family protein n=1 Tax=Streptacidiphilus jiangxiensis TaxID=235985 RepID=A0A1H7QKC9_STRJI|nr:SGNH/GDSL hydrolase family protein [Streptacidiphilus jiangxiensis]SEL47717.1 GDSL-like Lipase/Acylhydrolase family protein [Streptacidiphilus jiangxiensis]
MSLSPRSRRLVAAAAAVSAVAGVCLALPAQAQADSALNYVALGDSYSAGSGVLPLDLSAPLECARSVLNYPHDLANRLGLNLTDVTCGGAKTQDYSGSQYPGVAPQLDALNDGTDLVTMTIGGNDSNTFIDAILACGSAGIATLGFGHPCQSLYGSSFDHTIDTTTYASLDATLAAVKAKAPNARIAILGYPWIVPAQAVSGCYARMPIASGDIPYLRDLESHLNAAIQRAAADNGVTYVDMSAVSNGHDACEPVGTRWIEPILFGTNYVPVHPNATGESAMADQAAATLGLG